MVGDNTATTDAGLQPGFALQKRGLLHEAAREYEQLLRAEPGNFRAWHQLGIIAIQLNRSQPALDMIARALEINPGFADAHYDYGNALFDLGRYADAIASFERAIALQADHVPAHNNRGLALSCLGRRDEAIVALDEAIAIRPDNAQAYGIRGAALYEQSRYEAALASYDHALAIDGGLAEVHNGRGNVLARLGRYEGALASYDCAIAAQPGFVAAHINGGNVLKTLGQLDLAIARYDRAIAVNKGSAEAHYNRAEARRCRSDYEAAAADFEAAAALDPALDYLPGQLLHVRTRLCDWRAIDADMFDLAARIDRGEAVSPPFPILGLNGSPTVQLRAARIWTQRECPPDPALGKIPARAASAKIRIGYFSPDFRDHPVSALIAGLIESHDRSLVEATAFSFGPDTADPMRKRLEGAFDRFVDVRRHTDREIAELARDMEIDIAVDLAGFTEECRPGIFALRAAPLQVSYLGYLGTMGAPYMDYLIADPVIVPKSARGNYQEKILYLPCYQPNDSRRVATDRVLSRDELGLPATGFVFCCFNANYKILPATFSAWMRILHEVPGSVLLLYAGNPAVIANLRREASDRGTDPKRLVFGARLRFAEYLARYRAADLFLDTLPYNAGTTASDALWMGLPVLTCAGESFASRVAASLLTALGMPELIAPTAQEYERMAVELATDPPRLAGVKARLAARRRTSPLFDTALYTRRIEAAYRHTLDRHRAGMAPTHIGPVID